jgi:hypothetical protein
LQDIWDPGNFETVKKCFGKQVHRKQQYVFDGLLGGQYPFISEFNLKIYKQREFTLLVIPIKKEDLLSIEDFKRRSIGSNSVKKMSF